jgi:hypothetical protein
MIKHKIFISITLLEVLVLFALFLYSRSGIQTSDRYEIPAKRELVRLLELTDFAIWTEARYTRHPSQADWFTPFQDFPSSLEHFPAGSIIAPGNMNRSTTLTHR